MTDTIHPRRAAGCDGEEGGGRNKEEVGGLVKISQVDPPLRQLVSHSLMEKAPEEEEEKKGALRRASRSNHGETTGFPPSRARTRPLVTREQPPSLLSSPCRLCIVSSFLPSAQQFRPAGGDSSLASQHRAKQNNRIQSSCTQRVLSLHISLVPCFRRYMQYIYISIFINGRE